MEQEIVDISSSSDDNSIRRSIVEDPDPDMLVEDSDCLIADDARTQGIMDGELTDPEADEDMVVDEEEPSEEQQIVLPPVPLTEAPPPQVSTPPSIQRKHNERGFACYTESNAGTMTLAAVAAASLAMQQIRILIAQI